MKKKKIELRVGVKAFIRGPYGAYLLVKRSPIRYAFMKDRIKWDLPGGRMEPGKTMYENLEEEILAETGLTISLVPELIFAQDILYFHKIEKHVVRLTFSATCLSSRVQLQKEELAEYRWFSKEEMLALHDELDENVRDVLLQKQDMI